MGYRSDGGQLRLVNLQQAGNALFSLCACERSERFSVLDERVEIVVKGQKELVESGIVRWQRTARPLRRHRNRKPNQTCSTRQNSKCVHTPLLLSVVNAE